MLLSAGKTCDLSESLLSTQSVRLFSGNDDKYEPLENVRSATLRDPG